MCETFSDRMCRTATELRKHAKIKWEDYDYIEKYVKACKKLLEGDINAKNRIFTLLNQRREELIRYAMKTAGGVGKIKAIDYADQAIIYTFELTINGKYHVPSPMASMKSKINRLIKDNRKHTKLIG